MSTYWRVAGLSYLQYLNAASGAVRASVGASAAAGVEAREVAYIVERNYSVGENPAKVEVESWQATPYSTSRAVEE